MNTPETIVKAILFRFKKIEYIVFCLIATDDNTFINFNMPLRLILLDIQLQSFNTCDTLTTYVIIL